MIFRGYGLDRSMLTQSLTTAQPGLLAMLKTKALNTPILPSVNLTADDQNNWSAPGEDTATRRAAGIKAMVDTGLRVTPPGSTSTTPDSDYVSRTFWDLAGLMDVQDTVKLANFIISKDPRFTGTINNVKANVDVAKWPEYILPPPQPGDKAVTDALTALGLQLKLKSYQDISMDIVNQILAFLSKALDLPVSSATGLNQSVLGLLVAHSPRINAVLDDLKAHLVTANDYPIWLPVPAGLVPTATGPLIDTTVPVPGTQVLPNGQVVPIGMGIIEPSFFNSFKPYLPLVGVGALGLVVLVVVLNKHD